MRRRRAGRRLAARSGFPPRPLRPRRLTDERLDSGRLVQDRRGPWVLLAFDHDDARFVGHISDPLPFHALRTAVDPVALLRPATAAG